jgi:uncharacterized protein (DUF1800 family)
VEFARGSHPRGLVTRSFAEGATGPFFDVRFALFNASPLTPARTLLRFLRSDGIVVSRYVELAPLARATIDPEREPGLEDTAFATIVEADEMVIADRTMSWNETHYGSHLETSAPQPSTTWYLAEGATHSGFDLFYLLQNPQPEPVDVTVSYLRPAAPPIEKTYRLAANTRTNVWVDREDAALASTDVSAAITSTRPIVVERAMYLNTTGQVFGAGHASAGVTAPATQWFLAEGATGAYFDLFVLIANPGSRTADVEVTYLLPGGATIARRHEVAARSRFTIWVDQEDARLVDTAVSTVVRSINDQPIVVERAMWWPGPTAANWQEAHSAAGTTASHARWALGEGEDGGPFGSETYILVANTADRAGTASVTLHYESGGSDTRTFDVAARSRTTIAVRHDFAGARDRRFAAVVESRDAEPLDLVVEHAVYSNAGGITWAAGGDAVGTPLPAAGPDGGMGPVRPSVTIEATDGNAGEGGNTASFLVRRTGDLSPLVVTYAVGGSATTGSDFVPLSGRVTFAAGASTASITLTPVDDRFAELPERVTLSLFAGAHYRVGTAGSASALLSDDDQDNVPVPATLDDAARFLTQATFGPTTADIERLRAIGYDAWLDEQFAAPPSSFLAYLDAITGEYVDEPHLQEAWVQYAMTAPDQLRQRVAHALLEILVVSDHNGLQGASVELAAYMDVLMANAFGSYRTLLERVTLNPAMGRFLDMLKNDMEDPETGRRPNENYAREVLQLFSIGLVQLNPDGTVAHDGLGQPIPTHGEAEVEGFSRVFTGWTFHQTTKPYRFFSAKEDWRNPMIAVASHHSPREKRLLNGVVLPPFQTPELDLAAALDTIAAHPNVGPFISRQLIQRLVTSNPSPQYVARVAAVFANNGSGARGDLRAVVRAILRDPDARNGRTSRLWSYGKLREPMIRFVTVARAFRMRAASGKFRIWDLHREIGQAAFKAPSVFNFFEPGYSPPGLIGELGLVAPEFQITTESSVVAMSNALRCLVDGEFGPYEEDRLRPDYSRELALAATPDALLDHLNTLLFAGGLSVELRTIVRDAVLSIPRSQPERRVRAAVLLLVRSPEFAIQK